MEKLKLSEWAKANGKEYREAWNLVNKGEFPGQIEKNKKTGSIFVLQESKASVNSAKVNDISISTPKFAAVEESVASVRRNRGGTVEPTNQYYHIENGLTPFESGQKTSGGNDTVSPYEAIRLTQLAYYNFSDFSNVINIMTEFSTNKIYLRGGNKKSRDFFDALFKKINIQALQEKFFLEYYRSGNVFPYRLEAIIKDEDINSINKVYGAKAAKDVKLPVKYIIINPTSITCAGSISFAESQFYQELNSYEIQRLKKPITEEDKNFYNSMPDDVKKQISKGNVNSKILLPLDPKYIYAIFWKKADYEPLAIPLGWRVLKDLNYKSELKAIDLAVARTTERSILLITMGFENKNGELFIDSKAMDAMRALFTSESVKKTLVADFTTKGQWLIPEVDKILGPEKYKQVNEDIKEGLNNIIAGTSGEKFANSSLKVKLFVQRLVQSREAFLNDFLIPEIKRISKDLGFRNYPTPIYENLDLKDEDLFARILAQLAGIGYVTPEELFSAMESGRLPTAEESEESQRKFKALKDEGLYLAVQQNPTGQLEVLYEQGKQQEKLLSKTQEHDDKQKTKDRKHAAENPQPAAPQIVLNAPTKVGKPAGRPGGSSGTPKSQKKPAKPSKAAISVALIKQNLVLATELGKTIESKLLKHLKLEKLNEVQSQLKDSLQEQIMLSEVSDNWVKDEVINEYLTDPDKKNEERFNYCLNLAQEHQVNDYLAGIIANSQGEIQEEEEDKIEDPNNI